MLSLKLSLNTVINTYVCGIENIHNLLQCRITFTLFLLADELDVSQFAKVEIPFLFHVSNGGLQVIYLKL